MIQRCLPLLVIVLLTAFFASAQSTAFIYQGSLNNGGQPANGNFDFEFKLFDAASGGAQQGSTLQRNNVPVAGGVFAVALDFGAPGFPGTNRFLEIGVRPQGTSIITLLSPRQPVSPTPYALRSSSSATADIAANAASSQNAVNAQNASNAQTAQNALNLGGTPASQFVLGNDPRLNDQRNPQPGSASYIQNANTQQGASNFNIRGNGTAGGTLTGSIVSATTQYNIGPARVLASPGSFNFFAGNGAGQGTTGTANSFFGFNAGIFNSTGSSNTFAGFEAGRNNSAGANNSSFGKDAGRSSTTGNDNSFFGNDAGQTNTTGGSNSFFGKGSGDTNTTGSNNTIVGTLADVGADNLTNANAIGHRAFVETNNSLVLGSVTGKNGAISDTDVGIGTTAPSANLDIASQFLTLNKPNLRITNYGASFTTGIRGRSSAGTRSAPTASTGGSALLVIEADGHTGTGFTEGGRAGIHFAATEAWTAAANGAAIRFLTTANGTTTETVSMEIENNGNVGIGTTSPDQRLDVNGDIRVGSTVTPLGCVEDRNGTVIAGICSSDLRFKRDIKPFGSVLSNFSKLRPVNYFWRVDEFADKHFGTNQSYGLIAQDVEALFPELVMTDEKGYKAVNYSKLPLLTIQAVREQQAQMEQQLKLIGEQKKENADLRERLVELRAKIKDLDNQSEKLKEALCTLQPQLAVCARSN